MSPDALLLPAVLLKQQKFELETVHKLLQKRYKLEERTLQGLEVLLAGHQKNFVESKSIGLLKPILDQLEEEIAARREALQALAKEIQPEKESLSSLSIEEEEYEISLGITTLEEAVESYNEFIKAGDAAELARSELESWYSTAEKNTDSVAERFARGKLPPVDIKYRKATVKHQENVYAARIWLEKELPEIMSEHEERLNQTWTMSKHAIMALHRMTQSLNHGHSICSSGIEKFSPVAARANLEQRKDESLEHQAIRPAVYHNYALKGVESPVIFGADLGVIGKRLETLVEFLLEQMPSHEHFLQIKWKEAFEMEKESKGFATLMRKQVWSPSDLAMLLTHEFLQYSPLFPLRPGEAERFRQLAIPRARLSIMIDDYPEDEPFTPVRRHEIMLKLLTIQEPPPAEIFTQIEDTASIMAQFRSKWDFKNKRPWRDGIKCIGYENGTAILRRENGAPVNADEEEAV